MCMNQALLMSEKTVNIAHDADVRVDPDTQALIIVHAPPQCSAIVGKVADTVGCLAPIATRALS